MKPVISERDFEVLAAGMDGEQRALLATVVDIHRPLRLAQIRLDQKRLAADFERLRREAQMRGIADRPGAEPVLGIFDEAYWAYARPRQNGKNTARRLVVERARQAGTEVIEYAARPTGEVRVAPIGTDFVDVSGWRVIGALTEDDVASKYEALRVASHEFVHGVPPTSTSAERYYMNETRLGRTGPGPSTTPSSR